GGAVRPGDGSRRLGSGGGAQLALGLALLLGKLPGPLGQRLELFGADPLARIFDLLAAAIELLAGSRLGLAVAFGLHLAHGLGHLPRRLGGGSGPCGLPLGRRLAALARGALLLPALLTGLTLLLLTLLLLSLLLAALLLRQLFELPPQFLGFAAQLLLLPALRLRRNLLLPRLAGELLLAARQLAQPPREIILGLVALLRGHLRFGLVLVLGQVEFQFGHLRDIAAG